MSNETKRKVEAFLTAYEAAGLPPAKVKPVRDALARYDAIRAEARVIVDAERTHVRDVGRQVASGELSVAEGVAVLHDAEVAYDRPPGNVLRGESRLTRLMRTAEGAAIAAAVEAIRNARDDIMRAVDKLRTPITDELSTLADVVAEFGGDGIAAREAGEDAYAAFTRAHELEKAVAPLNRIETLVNA